MASPQIPSTKETRTDSSVYPENGNEHFPTQLQRPVPSRSQTQHYTPMSLENAPAEAEEIPAIYEQVQGTVNPGEQD